MQVEPFQVAIPQADLDDLHARLERTRWSPAFANDDWRYGTRGDYLRELVAYWRSGFDWRAQERAINAVAQFRTSVGGIPIHFVHVCGKGPRRIQIGRAHVCT